VFRDLYGVRSGSDEVVVDNVTIEKSTLERMMEMKAKQQAKRDSRTDPEPEK
jgi:hypothetical protein